MCAYKRKDGYYYKAKKEGYRSRAIYKLKQIDEKFYIFNLGDVVVDLGAAPGSWSEYAVEVVGEDNVIAIDLDRMRDIEGVSTYQGDLTDDEVLNRLSIIAGDVDVVISDMAPNISGNYSMDHARSVYLSQRALEFCDMSLKNGGNFVVKIFQGEDFKNFLEDVKSQFSFVKAHSPKASRESSSEMYIIGKGFKGTN
ncbi:MAG: RlmE family RNA methyltransferase [Thermoplasmatota archaeon]